MKMCKAVLFPCLAMLTIPLLGILYFHLNQDKGVIYSLVTDIDRNLPYLKLFVIPYLFWYIFIFISLFYLSISNRPAFYKTLVIYDIGLILASSVFSCFQTTVPRPILAGDDLLTNMVSFVYQMDQPFNCFPSIHVLTTYIIMKSIQRNTSHALIKCVIYVIGILIILSTLFIKQHVILDMIGAILLAEFLFRMGEIITSKGVSRWVKRRSLLSTMKKRYET